MKLSCLLAMFYTASVLAMPTISMPEMTIEAQATKSTDVEVQQINNIVVKTVPKFTADIRGALIKSGKFKVIDMSAPALVAPDISPIESSLVESEEIFTLESGVTESLSLSPIAQKILVKKPETDYYLIGQINYIGENEDSYPIKQTNNMTKQFFIEVAAEFKLVRSNDNSIMANFSSSGRASDVKIVTTQSQQVWHHNIGKLVSAASKDLAINVVNEMESQFNFTIQNEEKDKKAHESIVVTDVKVYN